MNTFDWKRFGTLVLHDVRRLDPGLGGYGTQMVTLASFPVLMTLFNWLVPSQSYMVSAFTRMLYIAAAGVIAGLMVPYYHYNTVAKKKQGRYFAMLPASKGEKWWSMALLTAVICPLMAFAASSLLDSLLALFNFGPWKGFIWQEFGWLADGALVWLNVLAAYLLVMAASMLSATIDSKWVRNTIFLGNIILAVVMVVIFPAIDDIHSIDPQVLGVLLAVQVALCLFCAWLSRHRMDRMTY